MNSLIFVFNFADPVTSISLPSKSPIEYSGTCKGAPLIIFHSPPCNQNVKGRYLSSFILRIILWRKLLKLVDGIFTILRVGVASPPILSPSISHWQKSIIHVENQTRKGSWRHSPAINAPVIQGMWIVSF